MSGLITCMAMAVTVGLLAGWTRPGAAETGQPGEPDCVVINLADTHSAYEHYPRLVAQVDRLVADYPRSEHVFLINGDVFEYANAVARKSQGAADWAVLRRLRQHGPVILNLGNHEFDFLAPEQLVQRAEAAGVTVIGTIGLAGRAAPLVPATADLEFGERVVRIVGIATDNRNTYPPDRRETLMIPDPVAWARAHIGPALAGADYGILLSHAGLTADKAIVSGLPEPFLFAVGGHDHLVLQSEIDGTPYRHHGAYGERLNVATVRFVDGAPRVTFYDHVFAADDPVDSTLSEFIRALERHHLSPEETAMIGRIPRPLALHEAAHWVVETLRGALGVDAVLLNHTSFGSGLSAGPLRRYHFDRFLRFDNPLVETEVDGRTLARLLARSNPSRQTPLRDRTGDFVYATRLEPEPEKRYRIATSAWVAMEPNQARYLGTNLEFQRMEGLTTKGVLEDQLEQTLARDAAVSGPARPRAD